MSIPNLFFILRLHLQYFLYKTNINIVKVSNRQTIINAPITKKRGMQMADERDTKVQEALRSATIGEDIPNSPSEFREETASEIATPVTTQASMKREETTGEIGASVPIHSSIANDETAAKPAVPAATRPLNYKEETAGEIGASVPIHSSVHREETAAEIAAPVPAVRRRDRDDTDLFSEKAEGGTGIGTVALALSILSLFVLPILFGAAGIVLGFVARARGASSLGAWAIGIGVVSLIIGIFILPFF
jgi:hypothetical protein